MTQQGEQVPGMAEAVEARRLELNLGLRELEALSELTRQGLQPVRAGVRKQYSDKTRRGIARALRWPPDWYDRLLVGDDPGDAPVVPDRFTEVFRRLDEQDALLDSLAKAVADLAELMDRGVEVRTRVLRQLEARAQREPSGP
jgi:hypothetical protein